MKYPTYRMYRNIAQQAYVLHETPQDVPGATLLEQRIDKSGAFDSTNKESLQCGAWKVNDQPLIIIGLKGTKGVHQLFDDARIIGGGLPDAFKTLVDWTKKIRDDYPDIPIHFTGHSLGGMLAQCGAAAFECFHVGWNGPGMAVQFYRYFNSSMWGGLGASTRRSTKYYLRTSKLNSYLDLNRDSGVNLAVKEDNVGNAYLFRAPHNYVGTKLESSNNTFSINPLWIHGFDSIDSAFKNIMDMPANYFVRPRYK
jgi:hypothetical protein